MNCTELTLIQNVTDPEGKERYKILSQFIYGYAMPAICVLGMVGNLLNLIILSRRKLRKSLRTLEQSANICLIWLAVSDLCFCVCAFITKYAPEDRLFTHKSFMLYYTVYHTSVINLFIMASTWITVSMAMERYFAVCHPLSTAMLLTPMRTKVVIAIVYVASALFNIPVLWRYKVSTIQCHNDSSSGGPLYRVNFAPLPLLSNNTADNAYRIMWAIAGNAIPLILLLYCNSFLFYKIHRSYKMRKEFRAQGSSSRRSTAETGSTLTVILVVIVVMFLILVAPSEIVMHVIWLMDKKTTWTAQSIEVVTNFMQAINFSVNFLLYVIISPYFRRTFRQLLCRFHEPRPQPSSLRQYNGSLKQTASYV